MQAGTGSSTEPEHVVAKQSHLHCTQLLLKHPSKHFQWRLQSRPLRSESALPVVEDICVMDIDQELLERLPLLAKMLGTTTSTVVTQAASCSMLGGNGAFSCATMMVSAPSHDQTQHDKLSSLPRSCRYR